MNLTNPSPDSNKGSHYQSLNTDLSDNIITQDTSLSGSTRHGTIISRPAESIPLLNKNESMSDNEHKDIKKRKSIKLPDSEINKTKQLSDNTKTHNTVPFESSNLISKNPISKIDSEITGIMNRLYSHNKASQENKKQIEILHRDLGNLVTSAYDYNEFNHNDANDFIYCITNSIKERLRIIEDTLNTDSIPKENINYLYKLAGHQLELHELPFETLGLMVHTLKEDTSLKYFGDDIVIKTKYTLDTILQKIILDQPPEELRVKQFISEYTRKINEFKEQHKTNISVPLSFASYVRLYNASQGNLFYQSKNDSEDFSSGQLARLLNKHFGLTEDEIAASVFPHFTMLVHSCMVPLSAQMTSLMITLDRNKKFCPEQNISYLHAQRFSFSIIITLLSLDDSENNVVTLTGQILTQLQQLNQSIENEDLEITGDADVFLKQFFELIKNDPCCADSKIQDKINQAYENWLLAGIFHYFDEILFDADENNHTDDSHSTDNIKKDILTWINSQRSKQPNLTLKREITDCIKEISSVMKNIRLITFVNPLHSLLHQICETEYKKTAQDFLSASKIHEFGELPPWEQLKLLFTTLESKLKHKKDTVFDKSTLNVSAIENNKIKTKQAIELWQVKFVESIVCTPKNRTSSDTSEDDIGFKAEFLEREIKNPSVLGRGMTTLKDSLTEAYRGKHYHEKLKVSEELIGNSDEHNTTVNLCCIKRDHDRCNPTDITIKWDNGVGCTVQNYLHDHDANHGPNGELEENVAGFDFAIPTHGVLKNWYAVFIHSTVLACSKKSHLEQQRIVSLLELNTLFDKKSSIDLDHSNFLLDRLRLLCPSEHQHASQFNSLERALQHSIDKHKKNQLSFSDSLPSEPERVDHVSEEDNITCQLSDEFCELLQPYFANIVVQITGTDFRHDLTADIHSVDIMYQIVSFLDIPVISPPTNKKMYDVLDIGRVTFDTLVNYSRRLSSEYLEHKKSLIAEYLYDMHAKGVTLTKKDASFLSALKNHDLNEFLSDVQKEMNKRSSTASKKKFTSIKQVMESVQESYEMVVKKQKNQLKTLKLGECIPCVVRSDGTEVTMETHHQKLQNKIKAGEDLIKHLKAAIDELKLDCPSLTPESRWTRISEWVEEHEASIMSTYCAAMLISINYLLHGESHTPHLYSTGGQLTFGSFDVGFTSIDVAQLATTILAVFTQFAQATGWKNDIRRMLDLLRTSDSLPFIASELPTTLQSDMINLFLADPEQEINESFWNQGSYCCGSNRKDTLKDLMASLLTRTSPLQRSHPVADRTLRVVGSTVTGAANGASCWVVSKIMSSACTPFCSWAPVIEEPLQTLVCAGATSGCIGGMASGTKLDYLSRGLNYTPRAFGYDRTMGGMRALVEQTISTMHKRENSTLIRLLVENPIKAGLNVKGFSLSESLIKFCLHLFDGYIAQIEIADFAEWRKSHQTLMSAAAAFNKIFEGKQLTQHDQSVLTQTLGEEDIKKLQLNVRAHSTDRSHYYKQGLADVANLFAYYVMVSDLYYFLYRAVKNATQKSLTLSSTTKTPSSTTPSTTKITEAASVNATESAVDCPANTKKLPYAGKGWGECWTAMYEEFRKAAPMKRFVNVALFKTIPNVACFSEVVAHNLSLGKKSFDAAMVATLEAGIAKNTGLGPLERLLQMSDSILLKCVGDIVNQMNTNVKEAMESVGQRNRDKATEPLKKTSKDLYMQLVSKADNNLVKAEKDLIKLLLYWQKDLGFNSLNAIASMRHELAYEALMSCDTHQEDFPAYKTEVLQRMAQSIPSLLHKTWEIPAELKKSVIYLDSVVTRFINDVKDHKDMFSSVSPLLNALSDMDFKVVDAYLQYRLYKPLYDDKLSSPTTPSSSFAYHTTAPRLESQFYTDASMMVEV